VIVRLAQLNFCKSKKVLPKARKFLTTAEKILAKFDVFCLRRFFALAPFDVNSCLHVETWTMHDLLAFVFDLHNHDHVKLFKLLLSFRFKLPCVRRILPSIVADHVKDVFEPFMLRRGHGKLCLELPCSGAIKL